MSKRARAVADLDRGVILARVEIAAPPERVFRALTTDELTKWWGADGMYKTTKFAIDLRPGGAWRSDGTSGDGTTFFVEGEVLEVEPNRRLVQTWQPSWQSSAKTTVEYVLEPIATGTRLTLRHSGFAGAADACDDHATGWEQVMTWLGSFSAGAVDRYFLLRLIAPRPTFAQDMSADERAVMLQHGNYLREQLGAGHVVAFGPVADPAGAWGLGLVRARTEAEVDAITAKDPVILAGKGFRYERLPMAALVY